MRALYKAKAIQIEITNKCSRICHNCSRLIGHHKNTYFMSLEKIKEGLESLEGYKGEIGIIGGEPTIHPQFSDICKLLQKYLPKERRGLWTNGVKWEEYEDIIRETFPLKQIVYNAHDFIYEGTHQPILIASKEIIKNEELRQRLIDNCWVQRRWSSSINPKGAFFCEVAAAIEMLFDFKGGWEVKKGWWDKEPKDFQDQVELYCSRCSMCIPFDKEVYENKKQLISPNNYLYLLMCDAENIERFNIYDKEYTIKDYKKNIDKWQPGIFRSFYQIQPNERLTKEEFEKL